MAACIAFCSSSMVLSPEGEIVAVATRRPLFVGDVRIDAGAENPPALLPPNSFHLEFKVPEKEWGWRRASHFSLLPPWKWKNGLTAFAYLFNNRLTSNFIFFFSSHFSLISNTFRHFASLDKEKDLCLLLPFFSQASPLSIFLPLLSLLPFFSWRLWSSWKMLGIGRWLRSLNEVEERGEIEVWERRWRGRRCPWKKISSAGDKSISKEEEEEVVDLHLFDGWREIVKENSWDGDEEDEGGREPTDLSWTSFPPPDFSSFSSSFPATFSSIFFFRCCGVSMASKQMGRLKWLLWLFEASFLFDNFDLLFIYGS